MISVTDSNLTEMATIQVLIDFTDSGWMLTPMEVGTWLFTWTPQDLSEVALKYVNIFIYIIFLSCNTIVSMVS